MKSRREFETPFEQMLGVFNAIQSHRQLGEHADRHDIRRRFLQQLTQTRLGLRNLIRMQRCARTHQRRIVNSVLDMLEIRIGGGSAFADGIQMIGELPPDLGLRRHRSGSRPQRGYGGGLVQTRVPNGNGHASSKMHV